MSDSSGKAQDYINKKIDSLKLFIRLLIGATEVGMENFYTFGPGEINITPEQSLVPEIPDGPSELNHFFSRVINSGQILAPLLVFLALLYFFKVGLRLFYFYHNKEPVTARQITKLAADITLGLVMVAMATLFILGYINVLVWIYGVEAAVGIFRYSADIVINLKEAIKKLPKKEPGTSNLHYCLQCIKACFNAIKYPVAFLLLSGLIFALAVISCIGIAGVAPVWMPVVMGVAQLVLLAIIVPLTVKKFISVYRKYKQYKAALEKKESAEKDFIDHGAEVLPISSPVEETAPTLAQTNSMKDEESSAEHFVVPPEEAVSIVSMPVPDIVNIDASDTTKEVLHTLNCNVQAEPPKIQVTSIEWDVVDIKTFDKTRVAEEFFSEKSRSKNVDGSAVISDKEKMDPDKGRDFDPQKCCLVM